MSWTSVSRFEVVDSSIKNGCNVGPFTLLFINKLVSCHMLQFSLFCIIEKSICTSYRHSNNPRGTTCCRHMCISTCKYFLSYLQQVRIGSEPRLGTSLFLHLCLTSFSWSIQGIQPERTCGLRCGFKWVEPIWWSMVWLCYGLRNYLVWCGLVLARDGVGWGGLKL